MDFSGFNPFAPPRTIGYSVGGRDYSGDLIVLVTIKNLALYTAVESHLEQTEGFEVLDWHEDGMFQVLVSATKR